MTSQFHEAAAASLDRCQLVDGFLELAGHFIEIMGQLADFVFAEGGVFGFGQEQSHVEFAAAHGSGGFTEAEDGHADFAIGNRHAQDEKYEDQGDTDPRDGHRQAIDRRHGFVRRLGNDHHPGRQHGRWRKEAGMRVEAAEVLTQDGGLEPITRSLKSSVNAWTREILWSA